ncbi:hypothetical protein NBRC111894_1053 [Sporolactobacillus inulinus]|uniref:Uncharacterized protein n=1 Tax=Sporolactobacillus inulinus TaxID=2078 RepID=A0A4Y1Z8W3_9BACL|nr:hypothetical protein NBRC111894_1053 [Sporolactobacillus inulinus]
MRAQPGEKQKKSNWKTAIRTVRVWLFSKNKRRTKIATRWPSGGATDRFDAESH